MYDSPFIQQVVKIVIEKYGKEKWFKGVCLDGIGRFYHEGDLEGAIKHALNETFSQDGREKERGTE